MQNATEPEDYIGMTRAYYEMNQGFTAWGFSWTVLIDGIRLIKNDPIMYIRQTPVYFANGDSALNPQLIHDQLDILRAAVMEGRVTLGEFYQRFEEIHPFTDGNGRIGAILYNYLRGSMSDPVHPPEFKKVS